MRALTFILGLLLAGVPCAAQHVLIQNESGSAKLEYDCKQPRSKLPDAAALAVIRDYSLRLAATLGRSTATRAAFTRMNDLYVAGDWTALERLSVTEACAGHVPVLAFPSPGAPVPELTLPFVNAPGVLSLRALRGRIVVFDFWGPWCGVCLRQMPQYVQLASSYPDRVTVIGVLMRERPDIDGTSRGYYLDGARAWLGKHPPGAMLHVYDADGAAEERFNAGGAGYSFVLDTLGRVMRSQGGRRHRMDVEELRAYLKRAHSDAP